MEVLTITPFGGGTASVAGSNTEIQYNDGGSLAGSADLTWDDTGKELGVGGDINLDDGGTYATTLQVVTPTANRTISFPDATGTVALVGGSSGQLVYNNAGAYAGAPSTSVGATGNITLSLAGAASTPPVSLTGTWFSGGTSTTTKPQLLIEPNGTTSTAWDTSGTGLGVNAASGFGGNLLDLQVNGTSRVVATSAGLVGIGTSTPQQKLSVSTGSNSDAGSISISLGAISNGSSRKALITKNTESPYEVTIATSDGGSNGPLIFKTSSTQEAARIDSSGSLLVGAGSGSGGALLQVNGNRIRVATAKTPASATDTGTTGEICWDANYIYVCTATNTWKRTALSTW